MSPKSYLHTWNVNEEIIEWRKQKQETKDIYGHFNILEIACFGNDCSQNVLFDNSWKMAIVKFVSQNVPSYLKYKRGNYWMKETKTGNQRHLWSLQYIGNCVLRKWFFIKKALTNDQYIFRSWGGSIKCQSSFWLLSLYWIFCNFTTRISCNSA